MEKLELLAPAGGIDKLKLAVDYGADAVYVGGKELSLRNFSLNFNDKEMCQGFDYAHKKGKKVYVAVNIFAKNDDFDKAARYFKFLADNGADAVILTDAGIISLCRQVAPNLEMHLSTQANTLNKHSAKFWADCGISRIVLARELSLGEIKQIHDFVPALQLEAFIHGAMCISYSGRCLLSNYLTSRDANRGECVQVCRWKFKLTEISNHSDRQIYGEQDERGTYFLNSKDLNLMEAIPDLIDAGITSAKIEGRMKSEYYLATVVNAYRRAIDEYYEYGSIKNLPIYQKELLKISNRQYTTAYNYRQNANTELFDSEQGEITSLFVGIVREYNAPFATIEMRNRFKKGQTISILSPNQSNFKTFELTEIFDSNQNLVDDAKLVQHIYKVKIPFTVYEKDILVRPLDQPTQL